MPPVTSNIAEHVGRTPMVELARLAPEGVELFGKLESFNPGGSVKDRIGVAMIEAAERRAGSSRAARRSSRRRAATPASRWRSSARRRATSWSLTLPQGMSREREGLLRLYGARVEITESMGGMNEAVEAARAMARRDDVFLPDQFSNPANPEVHRRTTGPELLEALDGAIDVFVAGVGTGGTITGVGEVLKARNPDARRRGRAGELGGAVGPRRRAAQDPGHRRRVRSRGAQPRGARRGHPGRRRGRDRDGAPAARARGRARRASPAGRRCGRRSRSRSGRSRRASGSS